MYVELHAASAFSFLSAASLPETLVDRAASLGYPALALLDRDGVYGAPRFHKAARAAGLRPLIGAVLTITAPDHQIDRQIAHQISRSRHQITSSPPHQLTRFTLPVLVSSPEGWRNLCRLVSRMKLRAPKGEGALALGELDGHVGGLIALPGQALLQAQRYGVGGLLDRLVGIFGRTQVYVEVQRHLQRQQEDDNEMLVCLAGAFRVPVVATGGVRFASPEERPLFDVLTCIREHVSLRQAGRRLSANAERYLKPPAQMARLFADMPHAVSATLDLADRLQFSMHDLGYRFPALSGAAGGDGKLVPPQDRRHRGAQSLSPLSRSRPRAGRARAGSHRQARALRLLPHRLGHRELLPAAGHPRAGARLGGQQRRLLQPRHHGRGSGGDGAAVRALSLGRARRVAGHRSRSAERRSPRAGDPARLREVRRARRGDDRQRHHLSRPQRRARSGQGARSGRGAHRSAGEGDAPVRVRRSRRHAGAPAGGSRAVERRRARCGSSCGCGSRCRTCRGTWASTPAAWW